MTKQEAIRAYEGRRAEKAERLAALADKASAKADSLWERGHQMAEVIPFGQPILIGHHSERRDRNYRDRIHNTFARAAEATEKAKYYSRRAQAAASDGAIMSDDPGADDKLSARIAELEKLQACMKACNAAIRKHAKEGAEAQVAALVALGRPETQARQLITPDCFGRLGFPSYALTNNSANLRRLKGRLAHVTKTQAQDATEIQGAIARLEDCPADNRVRLFFPGKPSEEIRSRLKHAGFRWSPTIGAWQAYRNYHSIEAAKREAGVSA